MEKVSEYDQKIPQSHTADHSWGRATRHQEDKQSKATSSLFPIKMIAKLDRTHSNEQKKHGTNIEPHNGSNIQQRINNNRATAFLVICTEKQYSENVSIDAFDNTRLKN